MIINIFKSSQMMTRVIIWNFSVIWSQNFILSLNSMTLKLKKESAKHFFTKRFRLSRKAPDEFC